VSHMEPYSLGKESCANLNHEQSYVLRHVNIVSFSFIHVHTAVCSALCVAVCLCCSPQTEDIGLEIITTAKIQQVFTRVPVPFEQVFTGVVKKFKQSVTEVNGSPRHSKEWPGKPANLEIQIFQG